MSLSRWLSILCWRQRHMMRRGLLQNLKNHHSKLSTKIHWALRISSILTMMPWWCRRSFKFDGSAQVLIVDSESVVSPFCTGVAITQGYPDIIPFPDVIWMLSVCSLVVICTFSGHHLDVSPDIIFAFSGSHLDVALTSKATRLDFKLLLKSEENLVRIQC